MRGSCEETMKLALLGVDDITGIDTSRRGHEKRKALVGDTTISMTPEFEGEIKTLIVADVVCCLPAMAC